MNKEDRILSAIEKIENAFGRMDERQNRVEIAIEKIENAVEKLDGKIGKVEDKIEKLEGRIDKLEENQNRMFDAIDTLSGRVGQLEGRMGRWEDALNRVDNRLCNQESQIMDISKNLEHLTKQTQENVRFISALMAGQTNMEDTVRNNHKELCNRFDRLDAEFSQWKDITAQNSAEIMYLKKAQ